MDIRQVPCSNDDECIICFLNGNEQCFAELVKHHRSEILHYIDFYLRDLQLSKDIFQEVLLDFVLLLRSGNYVEQGKVHHLLISMAHKRINEFLRQRNNHDIFVSLTEYDNEQVTESEEEEFWQPTRGEMARLRAYIKSVNKRKRALFLKRYHGISYENISRTMGISADAAKVEFSRMVKKLRKLLKQKK